MHFLSTNTAEYDPHTPKEKRKLSLFSDFSEDKNVEKSQLPDIYTFALFFTAV